MEGPIRGSKGRDVSLLEAEYVSGSMTLKEIADAHGVPYNAVVKYSGQGEWLKKRSEHRQKVAKMIAAEFLSARVREGKQRLLRLQKSADQLGSLIDELTADTEQAHRHIVTTASGAQEERVLSKGDARAMSDLARAVKDLASAMRSIYGLPTAKELHDMELADKKFEAEQARGEAAQEVVVRIESDQQTEGWGD